MSHFADDETLALITKLQATVQKLNEANTLLSGECHDLRLEVVGKGKKIQEQAVKLSAEQHKVKVLTDLVSSFRDDVVFRVGSASPYRNVVQAFQDRIEEALATVKGE